MWNLKKKYSRYSHFFHKHNNVVDEGVKKIDYKACGHLRPNDALK